jgi:hypothetical protein
VARTEWLKIEGYDDILNSFELEQPDDSSRYVPVHIWEGASFANSIQFPPVDLWLPLEHLPKLEKLRKLISRGLGELGHLVSVRLVDSLLPLICIAPARGRKKLDWLFSQFRATAMTQTLVLPFKREDAVEQELDLADFVMKPFRAAPKLNSAFAANSPLSVEPSILQSRDGNFCIERIVYARPFCDATADQTLLKNVAKVAGLQDVGATEDEVAAVMLGWLFFENYGNEYRWRLRDEFLADFRDAQASHVALGGAFFPIDEVRTLDHCLFLDEWHEASFNGSRGVMLDTVIEQAHTYEVAEAFGHFLGSYQDRRSLARTISTKAGKDPTVRNFARIVMMAREQAQEHRIEMAFLLCCTALEFLLVGGPNEPISRTLARRLGALKSLSDNCDFPSASRDIRELYDKRSKFAHVAKPIEREALDRLFGLCQCAYLPAVVTAMGSATSGGNWMSDWHNILDYLAAALAAGVQVDTSVASKAGIQLTTTPQSPTM